MNTTFEQNSDPLAMMPRVTTEAAAQIVGLGYEGFRSYMKRGLGRTGLLPGFHVAGANTHDDPQPRARWTRFDFASLCSARTAKILMDSGFSFDRASAVVARQEYWSKLSRDTTPTRRFLLVWPPFGDSILFEGDDIRFIGDRLLEAKEEARNGPIALIDLEQVQRHVMDGLRIPPAIIGTASPILAEAFSHAELDSLFLMAGFPDDPPMGSKIVKCQAWLRLANRDCDDALEMFGRLIAEFMDTEPSTRGSFWGTPSETGEDRRTPLREALEREGLSYQRGGHLTGGALRGPSKSLAERLAKDGSRALETEYQRAYSQVESDPPAAVTAACAILETVCKTYLETEGHPMPGKQVLGQLWSETSARLGLSPKDVADLDLKRILSGLSSIADGVAALRTHKGSAHGHTETSSETRGYRLAPRHARLAVHAAHTMAMFVLETWEARRNQPT